MAFEIVHTDEVSPPMGPYSLGAKTDSLVFTAGMLPTDPTTGKVVPGGIKDQARQTFENIRAVLESAGSSLDKVIKLTVFLRSMDDLAAVGEVRRELWSDPHPLSTTVAISDLAMADALIEVEAVAAL